MEDLLEVASAPGVLGEGFVTERLKYVEAFTAFLAGVFVGRHGRLVPRAKTAMISSRVTCAVGRHFSGGGADKAADSNMLRPCFVPLLCSGSPI